MFNLLVTAALTALTVELADTWDFSTYERMIFLKIKQL